MNLEQMKVRCPTAQHEGVGTVDGYELRFCKIGDKAFATIEPKEGEQVPVVLWYIFPQDEAVLDEYEEVPEMYRKEWIPVIQNGETRQAMVYLMNSSAPGLPTKQYYDGIVEGYQSHRLPLDKLKKALESVSE